MPGWSQGTKVRLAAQRFEESECESCIQAFKHRKSCPLPRLREVTSLRIPVEARGAFQMSTSSVYVDIYIYRWYTVYMTCLGKKKNDVKSDQSTSVCRVLRGVSSFKTQMHDHLWVLIYSFLPMAQNHCTMMQKKTTGPKSAVRSYLSYPSHDFPAFFSEGQGTKVLAGIGSFWGCQFTMIMWTTLSKVPGLDSVGMGPGILWDGWDSGWTPDPIISRVIITDHL